MRRRELPPRGEAAPRDAAPTSRLSPGCSTQAFRPPGCAAASLARLSRLARAAVPVVMSPRLSLGRLCCRCSS